jgi:hypothetical protein
MKKAGRNDPCPCGSGKKFKKCCEATLLRGRFSATRITSASAPPIQKVAGLTSFFQTHLAATPRKTLPAAPAAEPAPLPVPSPIQAELEENGNHLITS